MLHAMLSGMNTTQTKEMKMILINGTECYESVKEIKEICPKIFAKKTLDKVRDLEGTHAFIAGNNPGLGTTRKWAMNSPIRLAQTNSRIHGHSIQTLWAVEISQPLRPLENVEYLNWQNWMNSMDRVECTCPCGHDLGMHPVPWQSGPYCGDEDCAEYLEDHSEWYDECQD